MKIAFPLRMPTRKKRAYRINEISNTSNLVLTIVMTILAICTLIPVLLVVSVSLSSEEALSHGYKLIPEEFSLEAYTVLFKTGRSMARAYANTVFYSFTGTAMALIVMSLFAYLATCSFLQRVIRL
jgi:putative aldouronate transport system permease protein